MTQPLTPPGSDLRDFAFMPLDVVRLVDSDLTAIASGDEFKAAVILWCKAWHQVPAASLPDDDRMLAHLAGYGRDIKGWRKVRDTALRGFVMCDDGRLYHPVIAEKAVEALQAKNDRQSESNANAQRKAREREERSRMFEELKAAGVTPKWNESTSKLRDMVTHLSRVTSRDSPVTSHAPVTPNVTAMTGTGTGTDSDEVVSARARSANLEALLRKAAGWESEPAPKLAITGPIEALLDAGADLELDVLPTIRAIASQAESRTSWNYFVKAIRRATADRLANLKPINTSEGRANGNGARKAEQKSTTELVFEALGRGPGEGDRPPVEPASGDRP